MRSKSLSPKRLQDFEGSFLGSLWDKHPEASSRNIQGLGFREGLGARVLDFGCRYRVYCSGLRV